MAWETETIVNVCEPTQQFDPRRVPSNEFRYVDIAGIDRIHKTVAEYQTILGGKAPSRARMVIRKDDILVSTVRPNLNAVAMVPDYLDGQIASTGFCVLRPKCGVIEPRYLFYLTITSHFAASLTSRVRGANYPAVSDDDVKEIEIPLPPLTEQRRIVGVLEQADRLRRLRAEADAKAARILPALFIKMFGDPATNPMGWPQKNLGSQARIVTGNTPTTKNPEYYGSTLPWARPADLDRAPLVERTERALSRSGRKVARVVPAKSVLVVCIGATLGKVGMAGSEMAINQQINAVLPSPNLLSEFLFVQCALSASRFRAAATKSTLPILNKSKFAAQQVLVPPMQAQEKFVLAVQSDVSLWRCRTESDKHLESLFRIHVERAFAGDLTASRRETHKM